MHAARRRGVLGVISCGTGLSYRVRVDEFTCKIVRFDEFTCRIVTSPVKLGRFSITLSVGSLGFSLS